MAPQDDLTAERAALQSFYYCLHAGVEGGELQERYEQEDIGKIVALVQKTRQEALREARRDVLEVLGLLDAALTPSVSEMDIFAARKLIKETIARLASEGA